ncbi:DUF2850 domain-containing protein [Photobacterium leiognathi]|uniref:DUF2850 domain-containing protein n=1 Tax=Photobacterium leiognathi TaxID=553611 RepID=UPI002739122B|nr:DUF2850 domain-containing protein [Photobacterium leiognathi]
MDKAQLSQDNMTTQPTKRSHVIMLLCLLIGGLVLAGVFVSKHSLSNLFQPASSVGIYGRWQEHDVAKYAADSFEIGPLGIYHQNRLVTTTYEWDGQTLSYRLGGELYSYIYVKNTFIRQQPAHYISTFLRTPLSLNQF